MASESPFAPPAVGMTTPSEKRTKKCLKTRFSRNVKPKGLKTRFSRSLLSLLCILHFAFCNKSCIHMRGLFFEDAQCEKFLFFSLLLCSLIVPLTFGLRHSRSTKAMKSFIFPCFCARLFVPLTFGLRYSRSAEAMKSSSFPCFFAHLFVPLPDDKRKIAID